MKKIWGAVVLVLLLGACSNPNDANGRNAKDTTNAVTTDSTRMLDSTTSGMDTARESYDLNNGK